MVGAEGDIDPAVTKLTLRAIALVFVKYCWTRLVAAKTRRAPPVRAPSQAKQFACSAPTKNIPYRVFFVGAEGLEPP